MKFVKVENSNFRNKFIQRIFPFFKIQQRVREKVSKKSGVKSFFISSKKNFSISSQLFNLTQDEMEKKELKEEERRKENIFHSK